MNSADDFDHDYEQAPETISKTALKKEMLALQQLGEALVKLSTGELATITIADDVLKDAIQTARRIKHREGLRRQLQFIGKIMRKIDTTEIELGYQRLLAGSKEKAEQLHQLEQWRDQLLAQGADAVEVVIEKFPHADRQHLRQLVVQANKESTLNKPPASARKLFRYLRDLIEQDA